MSLKLTVEMLRAAYDYVRTTPPFNRWNLPPSEVVTFKIGRMADIRGLHVYEFDTDKHSITISEVCVGRTSSLMEAMAHEMVHVHQQAAKTPGRRSEHGAEFRKFAARVCKYHGFDLKLF